MKFLAKDPDSTILAEKLVYRHRHGRNNARLRALLRDEQRGYCAYTEKRLSSQDSYDVEHFDPRLKGTGADDYYNYYCTLHTANQRKRRNEASLRHAGLFTDRFYQEPGGFQRRIRYIADEGVYEEIDPDDDAARALIAYLGLNAHELCEERRKHVARLRDTFARANWSPAQQLEHLSAYPVELSYPTALAAALQLDLDPLL